MAAYYFTTIVLKRRKRMGVSTVSTLLFLLCLCLIYAQNHQFSLTLFNKHAIKVYQDFLKLRNETVKTVFQGNYEAIKPWEGMNGGYYLWDYFYPAFNCHARERLGKISEGGKILCNPSSFRQINNCNVFSFGVRTDISFELEFAALTNCKIYTFDPSVRSLPGGSHHVKPCASAGLSSPSSERKVCEGEISFDQIGLGAYNGYDPQTKWSLKTLETLMQEKKVDHLHLLKIDIESNEWTVFLQNKTSMIHTFQKVDQLLLELHFKQESTNHAGVDSGVKEVFEVFEVIEAAGLYAFSSEVNHNPSGFFSYKPFCIEYSFVRPYSHAMMRPHVLSHDRCRCQHDKNDLTNHLHY